MLVREHIPRERPSKKPNMMTRRTHFYALMHIHELNTHLENVQAKAPQDYKGFRVKGVGTSSTSKQKPHRITMAIAYCHRRSSILPDVHNLDIFTFIIINNLSNLLVLPPHNNFWCKTRNSIETFLSFQRARVMQERPIIEGKETYYTGKRNSPVFPTCTSHSEHAVPIELLHPLFRD